MEARDITVEDLSTYTDEQLRNIFRSAPSYQFKSNGELFPSRAAILSSHLVAKHLSASRSHVVDDEISAMRLARAIGVRVPQLYRVVPSVIIPQDCSIIMQRVYGTTLGDAWPTMGWWTTLKLAWQLRTYVQAMRAVTSQTAGGLVSGSASCTPWDEDVYGPELHASPSNLRDYMNWWLQLSQPSRFNEMEIKPFSSFVFSHLDLHMQNMIIDHDQRLWLVDWGQSGYYPPFMEYAQCCPTQYAFVERRGWLGWLVGCAEKGRWWLFKWIALGWYGKEANALACIHNVTLRRASARKGFPSERATREAARLAARRGELPHGL